MAGAVAFGARYRAVLLAANKANARRRARKQQRGFEETERGREFRAAQEERGERPAAGAGAGAGSGKKRGGPETDEDGGDGGGSDGGGGGEDGGASW